jgi:hypothetical protein
LPHSAICVFTANSRDEITAVGRSALGRVGKQARRREFLSAFTLIAAERTGRRGFCIEIRPALLRRDPAPSSFSLRAAGRPSGNQPEIRGSICAGQEELSNHSALSLDRMKTRRWRSLERKGGDDIGHPEATYECQAVCETRNSSSIELDHVQRPQAAHCQIIAKPRQM